MDQSSLLSIQHLNIVADENIPQVVEFFEDFGTVKTKAGRDIQPADLVDVDVLLVRSVTKVNATLLQQANRLQFVGTATAGTDHIDIDLLQQRDIAFADARGSNCISVAEYVLSAMLHLAEQQHEDLSKKTIGIVGLGHIGQYLSQCCHALGMTVLGCDPFLSPAQAPFATLMNLDQLQQQADIITLHTPLTKSGEHPTYHLFDKPRLEALRDGQWLINSARGALVDNQALLQLLQQKRGFLTVLDVFENEPHVERNLIELLTLSTPHIAGYSWDGKIRATEQLKEALVSRLQVSKSINTVQKAWGTELTLHENLCELGQINKNMLYCMIKKIYDVTFDSHALKQSFITHVGFDEMRKSYRKRREFSHYHILGNYNEPTRALLKKLNFNIQ